MDLSLLREFAPELWTAEGPTVTAAAGFHYPTRMAVIRLAGGDLFVWSPVELSPGLEASVEALGSVRYIVAPNTLHDTFLSQWQRRWPDAEMFAPRGLRQKRHDIRIDGELDNDGTPWNGQIDMVVLHNRITIEAVFFHRISGTVIFTDLIQNFRPGWFGGWRAIVARMDLMVALEPGVPRKFRLAFTDRRAARAAIGKIAAWPARNVLMAHGEPVTRDAPAFLRRAFRWLGVGRENSAAGEPPVSQVDRLD